MAKPRGKYDKSAKVELTDQDRANHIMELLDAEIAQSHNLGAIFIAIRNAPQSVQKLVIARLIPPPDRRPGRPNRGIPDEDFLQAVEDVKLDLASRMPGKKITDRQAIIASLETGRVVMGRDPATPFDADSKAGKQEFGRVQATMVRARKARKSKKNPA
jgi:hypothetical protein